MLQRLDRAHTGDPGQAGGGPRTDGRARRLGHRDVGAVRQARVDLGLGLVGLVENGRRCGECDRERDERHRAGEHFALAPHRGGHRWRQRSRQRAQRAAQRATATAQQQLAEAQHEQTAADPREDRREQRVPVDGDLRHALGDEHELVAVARRLPVDEPRARDRQQVQVGARPERTTIATADRLALRRHGRRAGVAPRGKHDRQARDQQACDSGARRPGDGTAGACAEARRAEARTAEHQRRAQADRDAHAAGERRFGECDADEPLRRRAARAQQRALAPPAVGAERRHGPSDEPGEQRSGNAEEEKEELRIERVLTRRVERGADVVADQAAARQLGL